MLRFFLVLGWGRHDSVDKKPVACNASCTQVRGVLADFRIRFTAGCNSLVGPRPFPFPPPMRLTLWQFFCPGTSWQTKPQSPGLLQQFDRLGCKFLPCLASLGVGRPSPRRRFPSLSRGHRRLLVSSSCADPLYRQDIFASSRELRSLPIFPGSKGFEQFFVRLQYSSFQQGRQDASHLCEERPCCDPDFLYL